MSRANEPAHPTIPVNHGWPNGTDPYGAESGYGMTIREQFAMAALQGITASPSFHGPIYQGSPDVAAGFAVACADRLVAELAKAMTPAREHA